MSGVVEESISLEKSIFGMSPTESLMGGKPKSPEPLARADPAPSKGESEASAQARFATEERRKRRLRLSASRLGKPQLGIMKLGT